VRAFGSFASVSLLKVYHAAEVRLFTAPILARAERAVLRRRTHRSAAFLHHADCRPEV